MDTLDLDYQAMLKVERQAVKMALEGLGVDWRRVPAACEIRYNTIAQLLIVPTFSDPIRIDSDGCLIIWGHVVEITDANRWAVIFLQTIAARISGEL